MDRPPNLAEEATESVNPGDQGFPAPDHSEYVRSESHAPAEPNEAFLRISQDMARVLERLTARKAPIDMVRCDAPNPAPDGVSSGGVTLRDWDSLTFSFSDLTPAFICTIYVITNFFFHIHYTYHHSGIHYILYTYT